MNSSLINLEHLTFSYKGHAPVIRDVTFQLLSGEKVGLVGPNGSGKTTLFLLLMGLLKPSSGTIELFGKRVERETDFREVRQRIGLLFQDADDQLFCPTVLEDVAFGPLNQGRSTDDARNIACETLDALGLGGFEDRVTHRLSGGEKRLVSLATILAMKPQVLLLDEPTTGLDSETMERLISILKDQDLAYVLISHDMDFLIETTDKVFAMDHGEVFSEEEMTPHTHVHVHGYGRMPHTHREDAKPDPS
ncbi:MAG: ABC transporter ATP-binding protein [Desulfatiglandaceae bacterium]